MAKKIAEALGILAFSTGLSFAFFALGLSDTTIVMAFLIGVLFVALRTNLAIGLGSSAASVLLFNYFFIEPRFTLVVNDAQYLFTFAVMLAVALVTSTLTSKVKSQAEAAAKRERRTAALYKVSQALLEAGGETELLAAVTEASGSALDGRVRFLQEDGGEAPPVEAGSLAVLPLEGASKRHGYLLFEGRSGVSAEDRSLLQAFAAQLVLALDRELSIRAHEAALVRAETEKNRSIILRSISHDLRTPLASIAGASSTLLDEYPSLDEGTRQELLAGIYEESTWLAEVVENLLNLSRLQNPEGLVRATNEVVEDVLFSAVQRIRKRLGARSLAVRGPEELMLVPMDGTLIEQALVNILDNAIRHTGEGTPILVSAGPTEDGSEVEFVVEDEGPGIPPEQLATLFDSYGARVSERSRGKGGLGLGLGICKAIVEAHGGRIRAENRSAGGARVSFRLPAGGRERS